MFSTTFIIFNAELGRKGTFFSAQSIVFKKKSIVFRRKSIGFRKEIHRLQEESIVVWYEFIVFRRKPHLQNSAICAWENQRASSTSSGFRVTTASRQKRKGSTSHQLEISWTSVGNQSKLIESSSKVDRKTVGRRTNGFLRLGEENVVDLCVNGNQAQNSRKTAEKQANINENPPYIISQKTVEKQLK